MSLRLFPALVTAATLALIFTPGEATADCESENPGFEVTWTTNANLLKDKLLAGSLPSGVTITDVEITPDPNDIGDDETIGYYDSFDLDDGANTLSIADGVILTTGGHVRADVRGRVRDRRLTDDAAHDGQAGAGDHGRTRVGNSNGPIAIQRATGLKPAAPCCYGRATPGNRQA